MLRLQKQLKEAQQLQQRNPDASSTARAESRARDLEIQRDDAQRQLDRAQAELRAQRAQMAAAPVENDINSIRQQAEKIEQERNTLSKALTQSRTQLADERVKNTTLQADVGVMQQKKADLERDLKRQQDAANSVVNGLRDQIKTLENTLKQRDADIVAANKRIDTLGKQLEESEKAFKELQVERDSLLQEREQMSALLKLNEAGRIKDLISQNVTLAGKLREAEDRVKKLSDEGNADKDLYVEALRDLAIAKSQIGRLQTERVEQDKRLQELEARLKSEVAALASGAANSEEVATLRGIIDKQLQIQKRRAQAREELEKAAKAIAGNDENYARAMQLLDGTDSVSLTPAEQEVLSKTKADIRIASRFSNDPQEVARSRGALQPELEAYDSLAQKAYGSGRLLSAKELYQMSVEEDPGNTRALCKLGFLQMKLEDFPSASDTFRRATELDQTNPYAYRMLGYSQLVLGDVTGAEQALLKAVEVSPDDGMSHVILGNVYMRQGRAAESESESRAAMIADPSMWEPYYNLAVFCSKGEKRKEEGKRYYLKSLELGGAPDFALEKKLGLGSSAP
ncbi:MAG: tetratricopeptide repeat protein [Luteolibacter sp.]